MASPDQGFVADGHFQRSGCSDVVVLGSRIKGDMSQVPGASQIPTEQAPIDDGRPTDPGSQGEHEHVLQPLGRSQPSFSQEGCVSVVEHGNRGWNGEKSLPI